MLDFGFSYSLGRIFADPIYSKDKKNLSSKISLAFLVLAAQGVLIAFVGIMLMEPIFNWFHISTQIRGNGEKLWIWCILAQSLLFPLRVFPAIIHAQNRVYLVNILSIVNQVANLIVFFWFITHQAGVVAYAYSSAVSTLLMYLGCIVCVFPGKNPMELTLARPLYSELIRIMKYAFSVFASSFASQASGAAQIMIITRLMGLDAVASYSVTSRIPALLSNMALKPFEAHRPQWIAEYCNDNIREFKMGYAKAISLSVFLLGAAFIASLYFIYYPPKFIKNDE
jgi:Na+-driven multidrug efflux pump